MQAFSFLVAFAITFSSTFAAPADTASTRQQQVNYAEVAALSQKLADLRNSVLGQIQQVTGDETTSRIAGQFNLGGSIQRLNGAANDISGAIGSMEKILNNVASQYSSDEKANWKNFG
ncbi:hypothetical protein JDV02_000036 [Purpureocillium takamizusanense]|uniref:Uncharacterized protein n=1 Tax=Purpureocillium takamizusanense TaxID=2060973 RepID=A0A9Q8V5X2_9HYPO|nr:uncharacterized protein JDV02_000036 [Purpureocillium takamizusanense]UNI13279.1 hypothetical protein JDV02_000036 [Purpureocillium takamizusanense]